MNIKSPKQIERLKQLYEEYECFRLLGFETTRSTRKIAMQYILKDGERDWCAYTEKYFKNIYKQEETGEMIGNYKKVKTTLNKTVTFNQCPQLLYNHTQHKKVYAFNRSSYTDIIYIDIDATNSFDISKQLIHDLNLKEIFIEINKNNGHNHIFFKTDKIYTIDELKHIEGMLNKQYKVQIDVGTQNKVIRYICSKDYTPGYIDNNIFIPFSSKQERITHLKNFKTSKLFSLKKLYNLIKPLEKVTIQQNTPQENNLSDIIPILEGRIYNGIQSSKKTFNTDNLQKYEYGCGTRNENLVNITSTCLRYGETNVETIADIILSLHDGTSKDINKYGIEKYKDKILKPSIEYMKAHFDSTKSKYVSKNKWNGEFISNIHYLKLEENKELRQLCRIITLEFKKIIDTIWTKSQRSKEAKRILPYLIQEMLGQMIYNDEHERIKNPHSKVSNHKFKQLTCGFIFSNKWYNSFCKYYNVQGINIKKLASEILQQVTVQIKHNKKGWTNSLFCGIPNTCKQYHIKAPIFYSDDDDFGNIKEQILKCDKSLKHTNKLIKSSLSYYVNYNNIINMYNKYDIYDNNTIDIFNMNYTDNGITNINIIYEKLFCEFREHKERNVDDW